jgi:hypothetical protein
VLCGKGFVRGNMTDIGNLKIPDWLPLKEREETLLEACSHEDVELHEDKQRATRFFCSPES